MASNISTENTYNIMPFTEGKFIGSTWEESGSKMVVYSKVDPSTIKDKQTISMAMLWVDDDIKKAGFVPTLYNNQYHGFTSNTLTLYILSVLILLGMLIGYVLFKCSVH